MPAVEITRRGARTHDNKVKSIALLPTELGGLARNGAIWFLFLLVSGVLTGACDKPYLSLACQDTSAHPSQNPRLGPAVLRNACLLDN